jgi:O-antigen ligase
MQTEPLQTSPLTDKAAWFVALLLSLSLLCLQHTTENLGAYGDQTLEAGRGVDESAEVEGNLNAISLQVKVGLLVLSLAGLYSWLTAPKGVTFRVDALVVLIVAASLWTLASYGWTIDRRETFRELVRLFAYIGIGAAIARRFEPRTVCMIIAIAFLTSVCTSLGLEIASGNFKPWQGGYRLAGTLHSNSLARHTMMVTLTGFALLQKMNWKWWLVALAMLSIAVLTGSRTGLIAFLAAIFAAYAIGRPLRETGFYFSCLTAAASLVLLAVVVSGVWDSRMIENVASVGREVDSNTLSGRVILWKTVWHDLGDYKLTGCGFGAFWSVHETDSLASILQWYPRHAHSAYVELIVNVGWIGLAMVASIGLLLIRRAARLFDQTGLPEYRALGAIVAAGFVSGVAEAAYVVPRDLGVFVAATTFSLVFIHPQLKTVLESAREERPTARNHWRAARVSSFPVP